MFRITLEKNIEHQVGKPGPGHNGHYGLTGLNGLVVYMRIGSTVKMYYNDVKEEEPQAIVCKQSV